MSPVYVERGQEQDIIAVAIATARLSQEIRARIVAAPAAEVERIERDEQLAAWITRVTGHRIPRVAVCADHDAPFSFIADLFFERQSDALVLANRAGGKTMDVAALHLANGHFKPGHETSHIGAIDIQAKRAYAYYRAGLRSDDLREQAPYPHIRETEWRNGSRIEILPGTEAQTQGGHPYLVTFDELEQGKRQPYENAKSMPVEWTDADGKRHPGQFVATSTRQNALGMMQRALDEAEESGTRTYVWCALETIDGSTCRDDKGEPLCESCPIFNAGCEGRALASDGWRSRDEIVRTYNRVGADTWEAQHLCRKPDAKALIYAPFNSANVTEGAEYVAGGGPLYLWYDWGFTDPTYIAFVQYRDGAFYQFDELTGTTTAERTWLRMAIDRVMALPDYGGPTREQWEAIWAGRADWPRPWPSPWPEAAGDPSAVQMRAEFKEHGIGTKTAKSVKHEVEKGQDVLRAAICTAGDVRRFFVHPRCRVGIRGLENYRARELADGSFGPLPDPDPANHVFSHGPDALRYGMWTQRRALGLAVESGGEDAE